MSQRFGKHRINRGMRNKLRERTNNTCIYCGMDLIPEELDKLNKRKVCNVEHLVPQAVYKWTEESVDTEEINQMRENCSSMGNLAIVHTKCNTYKNSEILNIEEVDKLKCSEELKKTYRKTVKINEKYIKKYKEIVNCVLALQNNKCYGCRKHINVEQATLRRIDNKKKRTIKNSIALCGKCNMHH